MSEYAEFLKSKAAPNISSGIEPRDIHPKLYPFQAAITRWAIKRGRAAIFADCGLGKTFMQIEWLRQVSKRGLIVAPLAVTHQTIKEGSRIGVDIEYITEPPTADGYYTTNYQRLHRFIGADIDAIVLDESSILKSIDGKTRGLILKEFGGVPFRLACTATPAPNDLTELGNHAEFLGIMSNREMSASFFVKESNTIRWRLKGHARKAFHGWLASWCVYIRYPSDIGYSDDGFILPELRIKDIVVPVTFRPPGKLFPSVAAGLQGRIQARKQTQSDRIAAAAKTINGSTDQWIVWCGLNSEGRNLHRRLKGESVLVEGSMSDDEKLGRANRWLDGEARILITKPTIYGYGMNFQNCHNVLFLGLGDSYEQYYQAIRRCWRFGQERPVDVYIVVSDAEGCVVENVRKKEEQAASTAAKTVELMSDFEKAAVRGASRETVEYQEDDSSGDMWRMMLGDSAERMAEIGSDSVGISVFSPPFVSLYTYTATERDLGNSKDEAVFFEHFRFIIQELLRVTVPGRNCCVHVSQIPAMLVRDGYIGMKDFRARTVQEFIGAGWIYHGECVIDKDPQAQAIRTHSKGLLFVQLKKDASWLRPALADYILIFRKPGENPVTVHPDLTNNEWIEWARPIWYGISESDTLNYREARTEKDERHICPLQLGVIERCIRLWSNAGELVCSPFAGIGSEGWVAVKHNRRFIGIELKEEYYRIAVKNLRAVERQTAGLFAEHA